MERSGRSRWAVFRTNFIARVFDLDDVLSMLRTVQAITADEAVTPAPYGFARNLR